MQYKVDYFQSQMNSESQKENDDQNIDSNMYEKIDENDIKQEKQDINSSDDEIPQDNNNQNDYDDNVSQVNSLFRTQKISTYSERNSYCKYNQILNLNEQHHDCMRSKSQMIQQLKKHGILYLPQLDDQSQRKKSSSYTDNQNEKPASQSYCLNITKITHTVNCEIVSLTVQLGPYQLQLTILNIFKQTFIYRLTPLTFQDNTNIYLIKQNGHQRVCKLIMYNDYAQGYVQTDRRKQQILHSISEYCISRIMSALKIGPKILKSYQFDLIVSESGIEFYLEKCIGHQQRGFGQQDESILKTNLKEMHQLGFIHRDIKPANIMYSMEYQKFVFIDFGISEYRKQRPGQLIKSKFSGTVMYCTQEMRKLLNSSDPGWVDAHYNDSFGLELSVKQMQKETQFHQSLKLNPRRQNFSERIPSNLQMNSSTYSLNCQPCNEIFFQPQLLQREIKQKIYSNQLQQLTSINANNVMNIKNRPLNFQRKILDFLYQIPATQSIRRFYLLHFNQQLKHQSQFVKLNQCFKTPVYIESYKGERAFLSLQQRKCSETFMKIYLKMKSKYQNIINNNRIIRREYQELLKSCKIKKIDNQNVPLDNKEQKPINFQQKALQLKEYQKLLVEYVNFKNIQWQVGLKQKAHYCMIYAKLINLDNIIELEQDDQREIIQKVLYNIAISFSQEKSTLSNDFWPIVVSCIQNYFIVENILKTNLSQFLGIFLYKVFEDSQLTNLSKISRALDLLNSRKYLLRRHRKLAQYYASVQLQDLVQNKIKEFIDDEQRSNNNKHMQMLQFYQQTFCLYKIQKFKDFYPVAIKNLDNLHLRQQYPQLKRVFDLVQFQIGIFFERNDKMEQARRIHQQKKHDMVINQQQLNIMHFQLVLVYEQSLEIKKIKKYLNMIDTAINCPEISVQYFIQIRIFLAFYFQQQAQADNLLKKLKKVSLENMDQFMAINNYEWAKKIQGFQLMKQIKTTENFYEFLQLTGNFILRFADIYDQKLQKITIRYSKNLLYLKLLHNSIRIQRNFFSFRQRNKKLQGWQPFSDKLTDSKYFPKIISIKYFNNLTIHDESFMIYYELYLLKDNGQFDKMVEYLVQKQDVIQKILSETRRFQKSFLNLSLALATWAISKYSTKQKLAQLMNLIVPILDNPRMGCLFFVQEFHHKIMEGLVKTNNFDFIMKELIAATKYYSRHVSNSNISFVCRFYSNVANVILFFYKEQQCVKRLKKAIQCLNPKENSIFGIFLLFFIYPCNRRKIIKYLYKCLDYINHTGKQIILCRLYKQLGKLKYVTNFRRRYLIKKDLIYPSKYTINLRDMKAKINMNGQLNNFQGEFLEMLQKKLVKLGKCCQIYSEIKTQNETNRIFDQVELDLLIREDIVQKWQRQFW